VLLCTLAIRYRRLSVALSFLGHGHPSEKSV
jgi:hypothetical protein